MGLLYRHGYFKQSLNRDGWQQETYPVLDPDELPLVPLREADGTRTTVRIDLPDGPLLARVHVAQVGRVPLLLLDSDIEENPEHYRDVTDRLYGGNSEHRLRQELLLGVGGVRALRAWSRITGAPEPEVFHTNEGHAGFLGIERIRELTSAEAGPGLDFDEALEVCRAGTVFTTHTPVPAGIDRFPRTLVEQYFGGGSSPAPGVPVERVLALGAEDYAGGDPGVFNMAVMGFRLAQRANGVSRLHGHVSRGMFNGLWPAFDEAEVPITSITNGVHGPTWVAREIFELAAELGADVDDDDTDSLWPLVDQVPDRRLWDLKRTLRARLVADARTPAGPVLGEAGHGPGRDRLGGRRARPRRAHHRLRPPGALVQAPDADAARPGAAQAAPARPGAPDPAGDRRQVAPGRRRRQAADPGDGPVRRRPRGAAPGGLPARTTTSPWRSRSTPAATCG